MRVILLALTSSTAYALSYTATVLDCSGQPASGAIVLHEIYGADGLARIRSACTQTLDSMGRFTCGKMTAGRYAIVFLVHPENASAPNALASPLLPQEMQNEGSIRFNEDNIGSKHTLHVCSSAAGQVTASIPDKPPASYLNLAFATSEGDLPAGVSPVYDAETGDVSMPRLEPGTYHLQAYWFANGTDKRFDQILHVPEDTQSGLVLEQSVYRISGTVRTENGASLPTGINIIASCGQFGSMTRRKRPVAEDGSFSFGRLDAATCSFSLGGAGTGSIVSIELNDSPSLYGQAQLKPFPAVNHVVFTVTTSRSALVGHVDGKGEVAGNAVVACSVGSGECATTKAARDGSFHFSGLSAGPYHVSSWLALDRVEYRVPAFMRQFAASGEVQLTGGQTGEVSVPVSHLF